MSKSHSPSLLFVSTMTDIYGLIKIILNRLNFYKKQNKTNTIHMCTYVNGKPLFFNFDIGNWALLTI